MTLTESPFRITVYSKDYERLGWVDAPTSQSWHVRHNQQSNGEVIVPWRSDAYDLLNGPGKRVVVRYQNEFLLSGPVRTGRSEGFGPTRLVHFDVQDDFRLLNRFLMWPNPDRDIWDQTSMHDRRKAPVETALLGYLSANIARLEEPITLPASLGRGPTVAYNARFVTPMEDLLARLDSAGLGIRVRQKSDGTGLAVQIYEGTQWPILLSEEGGTVLDSSLTHRGPEITRVVIGGAFEDKQREFYTLENPVLEEQWGDVIETFVDAGSVSGDYEDAYAEYRREYQDLKEAQADSAARIEEYRRAERAVDDAYKAYVRAEKIKDDHPTSSKALSRYNRALSRWDAAIDRLDAAQLELAEHGDDVSMETVDVRLALESLRAVYAQYRDDLLELGEAELAKGRAMVGFSVNLQEGEIFKYGGTEGIHVGDKAPIQIGDQKYNEVIRQVSLSLSTSGQFTVTPVIGEVTGRPTTKLMKLIGSALKGPNRVRTR